MVKEYPISIQWIEDDKGGYWFAYLSDWGWSTVSATANTVEETLLILKDSLKAMKKYYSDTGRPIPKPSKPPFEDQ